MIQPGMWSSPACFGAEGTERSIVKSGSDRSAVMAYPRVPSKRTARSDSGFGSLRFVCPSLRKLDDESMAKVSTWGSMAPFGPHPLPCWLTTRSTPWCSSICHRLWIWPAIGMSAPFTSLPFGSLMSTTWMTERPPSPPFQLHSGPAT